MVSSDSGHVHFLSFYHDACMCDRFPCKSETLRKSPSFLVNRLKTRSFLPSFLYYATQQQQEQSPQSQSQPSPESQVRTKESNADRLRMLIFRYSCCLEKRKSDPLGGFKEMAQYFVHESYPHRTDPWVFYFTTSIFYLAWSFYLVGAHRLCKFFSIIFRACQL